MKKTYINPSMVVVKIQTTQLMAGSELGIGAAGSANDAESRYGRNFFDDDEEDF